MGILLRDLPAFYPQLLEELIHSGIERTLKKHGIHVQAFYDFLDADPNREEEYVRALKRRSELVVDQTLNIADEEPDAHRARVRIETRRWYASKMAPTKYGERIDLNVNNTVDIKGALAEAHARTKALPSRLVPLDAVKQVRDIIEQIPSSTTDSASAVRDAEPAERIEDLF